MVRLGTRDEEGPGLVQHIKAGKVGVATIHDVDGSGFRQEHIERMNVVQLAIRDVDKTRNVAPQVEQRVHLHRCLGGAEVRPRKDRQAQSGGRRVQGVDGIGQVQPQFFVDVQRPRLGDEPLGQRRMAYASRAFRWHRPASSAGPAGGSPCDRVSMRGPRGRSRCRAGFPGRSAGRGPWTGIARRRKASGPGDRRHTGRRSA